MSVYRQGFTLTLTLLGVTIGSAKAPATKQRAIEATVCQIAHNPSAYNNKLVKVRGFVQASGEYSMLQREECSASIWFALADGSAPPGMIAIVNGLGRPGVRTSKGSRRPPIAVHLIRDSNYLELMRYLEISAKGESCADGPPPSSVEAPDCTAYRVAATFTGRVDGVSRGIHAAHLRRSASDSVDGRGFGHMGMFDAQLVVRSIENVIAVKTSE